MTAGRAARGRKATDLLGEVPLFQGLSKKELSAIAGSGKEVNHPEGREIVKEGSTEAAGFHLILEGTAKVLARGRTVNRLGPGDHFGEMSLLDGGPRSASVVAETDVHTFSITAWAFRPLIDRNPSIARKLLVDLSRRLREATKSHTL
jgi:CRP-like cAMP-binding protein